MSDAKPVIVASELEKVYGEGPSAVHAVSRVSLNVQSGELVLVMGPSGSGKTTMLSMLGGLLRPTTGLVSIEGVDLTSLSEAELAAVRLRRIGFVFQAFNLLSALTVEENILFPARLGHMNMAEARTRARQLMERLGLSHRRDALPKSLSGGEKQRVAVARALINEPPLILADEPTGNLDSKSGQEVVMILHDIARDEGRAIVIVTHDPRVEDVADRILWIEDGALRDRKAEPHEWAIDPVCGMRVDERTATIFTEHVGVRHVFCTERCRERFVAAPESYTRA